MTAHRDREGVYRLRGGGWKADRRKKHIKMIHTPKHAPLNFSQTFSK